MSICPCVLISAGGSLVWLALHVFTWLGAMASPVFFSFFLCEVMASPDLRSCFKKNCTHFETDHLNCYGLQWNSRTDHIAKHGGPD